VYLISSLGALIMIDRTLGVAMLSLLKNSI